MAPSDSPLEARQLKLIVDAIPALVSYVDDQERYQFNNKAYEDWFGHSAEALRGRHLKELLGAVAYERVRPHVEAALAGQRTEFEGQVPYKDGGTRFIRAQYVPDFRADGSVAGYFALINDVTHRVEAERALKESEHRFRDTADVAPAILWVTDPDGSCSFLSRGWYEFTGQTQDQARGFGWLDAIHPDDRKGSGDTFHQANARRESFTLDHRVRRFDGQYRWAIDTGNPHFDVSGNFKGFVGSVIDVHDRKVAEQDAALLHRLTMEMARAGEPAELYERVMDAAMQILDADFAGLQRLEVARDGGPGTLKLLAYRGFAPAAAVVWEQVAAESNSACGTAVRTGRRCDVLDTLTTDVISGEGLARYTLAGVRAAQSTPLTSRSGRLLGAISTYWRHPRDQGTVTDRQWRLFDVLVQHAADLLERVLTEQTLREHEYKYRTLFDGVEQGFCFAEVVIDENDRPIDYRILESNPAFERHTGLRGAAGRLVKGDMVPGIEPFWIETYGRVALTGEPAIFEHRAEALDGGWFEVQAFRCGDPSLRQIGIFFKNIKEQRLAELAIRASEERLQLAMEIGGAGSWDQDLRNGRLHWSESHFTLLGHQPTPSGEATSDLWQTAMAPGDLDRVNAEWSRAERERDVFRSEHQMRRADGRRIWVSAAGRFFYDDSGIAVRFVGVFFDVTERKRMEQELQEAGRRKDEFLATLAHELRGPLAPVRSSLELLKRAGVDREMIDHALSTMDRQIGQMVRLIDDLMDVSRITRDRLELKKERTEVASVVHHAVEACRPHIDRAAHDLRLELPAEPIYLLADPARLSQVVGNLLTNSCKYTDPGGRILLSVELDRDEVVIAVTDNGIGIPAEMLPRVFDLFTQVDQSMGQSQGGLGIGLSLVKRLVEMHDGRVSVHSDGPGHGSRFVVRLPNVMSPPEADPPVPLLSGERPRGRRILVVDDNTDSARCLAMLLKLTGNETATAHDGAEAVAKAASYRPDVILLDIGLPTMTGHAACRAIREQPGGRDITIVALTGWGQEEDRRKSQEAGFDAHLVKPVDHEALAKVLGETVRPAQAVGSTK